jgi:glucan biosynthesis protein C
MNTCPEAVKRMYFLDNLRAFIILLVVVFHVALGYTTWKLEWWPVNDSQNSIFFDAFILATDVFIMPVMFLIAGYFAPPALLRKGAAAFWRDKLGRIVLPWVGGTLLIAPFISYSSFFSRMDNPPPFLAFWGNEFFGRFYQQAHYWFLGILALFFLLFTIAAAARPAYFNRPPAASSPPPPFFPLFCLLTAAPFFAAYLFFGADEWVNAKYLFMIQPVRVGLYLCYFALGVHAWKNAWFTAGGYQPGLLGWGPAAVLMLVVFLAYRLAFTLTPTISVLAKAGHALVFAAFSLTAALALIALFARFADSGAYLWRRLAANSYVIYFIHQCVIIPLAYLVQKSPVNIWTKYFAVAACAVMLCFLLAEYLIGPVLAQAGKRRAAFPAWPR